MRLVKLNDKGIVMQIRHNAKEIIGDEFESDVGELGQIYVDGVFQDVPEEQQEIYVPIEQSILAENQYQTFLLENILLGGTSNE